MLQTLFAPLRGPRLLAAALLLAAAAALAPSARAQMPELSGYQALLNQYVVRIGDGKEQPFNTRFDYEQLYVDEGIWSKKRSERLETIHSQMFAVQPSAMDEKSRLAWAINAYNFLVIERATLHLLVPMRKFQRYETVDQMSTAEGSFFDGEFLDFEGRAWSIRQFERTFVYGDSTPMLEPRVKAGDPRLMFALCGGSVGGASIAPRAFKPESLGTQLDQAVRAALARPTMARWDERARALLVSDYLARHRVDFGGPTTAIVTFLGKHAPPELRSRIKKEKVTDVTRFMPVDPALNQFLRPKPKPPTEEGGSKS